MKVVLSWLRSLCPTELSADELAEILTRKGAEIESVERPWEGLSGVVVARVIEVRDHPDSDTLCLARVQTGAGELEVVVGVRNMRAGDLVPLAPPGARVPGMPEPLSTRTIRGMVSNGMLCAPDEIGVSPSHEGILILPDEAEPGTDVAAAYGLDDAVLDIEVTPNRPDFLSVLGIAREVSAATGTPLTPPPTSLEEAAEAAEGVATLEVRDLERCPRYLARILRGVTHVPSPVAIQARLTAAGMRPISAVVDATNYAMLEIGQPLHPFDLALLKGPGIVVRTAEEGETLVTLDAVERRFTADDLLICDAGRPVAVAGVMGGELAEVSPETTDVLLEAATFSREAIQRTRRRLGLSTEASMRFERGVDPEATPVGADRAAALVAEWCGASVLHGVLEVGGAPARRRIGVRASRAGHVIGSEVTRADAERVFDRLGMTYERADDDTIRVEVPGYRVDIEREIDLIEEVVRVRGYEHVASSLPPVRLTGGMPPRYAFGRRIRGSLVRAGLREVRPIPFVSDADLRATGGADAVRVTNPLQADEGWLRTSLLPGLVRTAGRNAARHVRSVAIFEVSTVWSAPAAETQRPGERTSLGLLLAGTAPGGWTEPPRGFDVFDAKGAVEAVLSDLGIEWRIGPDAGRAFHPGRSSTVLVGEERVGAFGEIHPAWAAASDLSGRAAAAELDVEALMRLAPERVEAADVPRFPPVRRDLAFVVDVSSPAGEVQAVLERAAGDLLDACILFDVHVGTPLPEGKKSLAFSVELRAPDRTLTDREANEVVDGIVDALSSAFGAELRTG